MSRRTVPPSPIDRPLAAVAFDRARFERETADELVFFWVDGAPRTACATEARADGTLVFSTRLCGEVIDADASALTLQMQEHPVMLRYHLPSALGLQALIGRELRIELTQTYRGPGRATIELQLRDEADRLLLWAHDGRLPGRESVDGIRLRVVHEEGETARLAVRSGEETATLPCGGTASLSVRGRRLRLGVVRLGPDDLSVLVFLH